MLDWLYGLLGSMLSFFDRITGSYAIALLFYALIFKLLFLFFGIKQQKNQIKMAKLAPKISLIKAKYRGRTDRPTLQKQQQEIMELQQKEGYSPLSGCLPLLLQLPIILLLYAVIRNPVSHIAKTTAALENYNEKGVVALNKDEAYSPEDGSTVHITYEDLYTTVKDKDGNVTDYKYREVTREDIVKALNIRYNPNAYNDKGKYQAVEEIQLVNLIMAEVKDENGNVIPEKKAELESFGIDFDTIPNFTVFGVNLAEQPSIKNISILVIIPVLAAALTWLSMWLTRRWNGNPMAEAQDAQAQTSMKIMDLMMPLMTLFLAFKFSGMLGLYWVYQSGLGIAQTFALSRLMPLPKYTEEELREMRKAEKAAEKAQRQALKGGAKYRSLHYIDEEDYAELPDAPKNEEKKTPKTGGMDVPNIKD